MERIAIAENKIQVVFEINDAQEIKLLHFSALPFDEEDISPKNGSGGFSLVEIQVSGQDRPLERHGNKYVCTSPGYRLKYKGMEDARNELGRKLIITTYDGPLSLLVESHLQFFDGLPIVRSHTVVKNQGEKSCGLEYVSSFSLTGVEKEGLLPHDKKMNIHIPHNGWQKEFQWQSYTMEQIGMPLAQPENDFHTSNYLSVSNTGHWSSKEHLPMACLENRETNSSLAWQIEQNGSWHWELADRDGHLYIQLSGPNEIHSHWWKSLKPGESFTSVPAAVAAVAGGLEESISALTRYRRIIRRENRDNENLPVIFNDYMNCLWGHPNTQRELPLIDKAAEAGCEYFCIDAGWYSSGFWWNNVGQWIPSRERFPEGLKFVLDRIRDKGMIPGVWLELEVMGIQCPLADQVPKDWYFVRHGEKVYDRSRYQLDFRNPQVIAHANEVIDRLVGEYGVGYIKMDYNIEPGIGTELNADSFGDGLLGHERAYLAWLDSVFSRYPHLVIENCSSGGLRIDYAMLSRYSIQSTSDQENYLRYATIAANCPTGLTPEQAAVWSYPLENGDEEETIFNMVNAMLLRIHQSGHLANLSPERFQLVKEGITCYKGLREDIKNAVPFWPMGLSKFSDDWVALGLRAGKKHYLAVWRRNSSSERCALPLPLLKDREVTAACIYPERRDCAFRFQSLSGLFTVNLPHPTSARLFLLEEK